MNSTVFCCSVFLTALCRSDEKLELQWTLEGHQLGVVSVDISHNGAIAASSSLDAHIRLWDLESGKQIKSMDAGPGEGFRQHVVIMVIRVSCVFLHLDCATTFYREDKCLKELKTDDAVYL